MLSAYILLPYIKYVKFLVVSDDAGLFIMNTSFLFNMVKRGNSLLLCLEYGLDSLSECVMMNNRFLVNMWFDICVYV